MNRYPALLLALLAALPGPLGAQAPPSLDLTIGGYGVSIGDSRRVNGIRINFRDRALEEVNGANITLWTPHEPARGVVRGAAIGLPVTGARQIDGLILALLGAGASERMSGVGIAPLGLGAGGDVSGIMIGGLGIGAGGRLSGVQIGGLGVGSGGDVRGVTIGGIGAGGGGSLAGVNIGGLAIGSGGRVSGLNLAGLGVGAGGGLTGVSVALLGVGSGGDISGITVAGIGAGSGGTIRWLTIAGAGAGAPRIEGVAIAGLGVGGADVQALVLTPGLLRIDEQGSFTGASVNGVSWIDGAHRGLTIGLLNYARELRGVQIGLLNYAASNRRWLRLLPLFNTRFD